MLGAKMTSTITLELTYNHIPSESGESEDELQG